MQGDFALGGSRHQLDHVVVGADQMADAADLGRDDIDRGDGECAAVADALGAASAAQQRETIRDRALLTHQVDHRLGPASIRQRLDL